MLLLSLCVVTLIQLTSSQPTYDVIQQDNDVSTCKDTNQVLSKLFAGVSQMQTTISQLKSMAQIKTAISQQDNNATEQVLSQLVKSVSQVQRDVAELKDLNQQQNDTSTCGRTEQVLSQLATEVSQTQQHNNATEQVLGQLVTATSQLMTSVSRIETRVLSKTITPPSKSRASC